MADTTAKFLTEKRQSHGSDNHEQAGREQAHREAGRTGAEAVQHPASAAPDGGAADGGLGVRFAAVQPETNEDLQDLARDYNQKHGLSEPKHTGYAEVDIEAAKDLADAYDRMEHNPNDPAVKRAYAALVQEVHQQWDHAEAAGYVMEPWTQEGQPYYSSKEMIDDVVRHHHLYFFKGGDLPSDHPLAAKDEKTGHTANDKFRAIHDLYGHAKGGYEFGPRGEENAYLSHREMFTPEAGGALHTETRQQNSWVNASKHMRDPNGNLLKKGDPGWLHPTQRPYAEQKAALHPKFGGSDPGSKKTSSKGETTMTTKTGASAYRQTDGSLSVWIEEPGYNVHRKTSGANLSRLLQRIDSAVDFMLITSFRGADKDADGNTVPRSKSTNESVFKELPGKLRSALGTKTIGAYWLVGHWTGCSIPLDGKPVSDCEALGGEIVDSIEYSWMFTRDDLSVSPEEWLAAATRIAQQYDQDSFILRVDGVTTVRTSDGTVDDTLTTSESITRAHENLARLREKKTGFGYTELRKVHERGRLQPVAFPPVDAPETTKVSGYRCAGRGQHYRAEFFLAEPTSNASRRLFSSLGIRHQLPAAKAR